MIPFPGSHGSTRIGTAFMISSEVSQLILLAVRLTHGFSNYYKVACTKMTIYRLTLPPSRADILCTEFCRPSLGSILACNSENSTQPRSVEKGI